MTEAWKKINMKALATIILCVEKSQYSLVRDVEFARTAWESLQKYHEKNTIVSKILLYKRLSNKKLFESGNMELHLMELDELMMKAEAAGWNFDEMTKVGIILSSVPDSYENLVMAMEVRKDDELTVELVKSKLIDENSKRVDRGTNNLSDDKVLKTGTGFKPMLCHYCEKPGHFKKHCRKWLATFKKRDNQKNYSAKKVKDVEDNAMLFMVSEKKISSAWYIDSGATRHMCSDKSFFTSFNTNDDSRVVQLANGSETRVAGSGMGSLICVDEHGNCLSVKLEDVLFVPELEGNLISVSKLTSRNLSINFDVNGCKIRKGEKTIAVADRLGNLFKLREGDKSMLVDEKFHNENCQHQWHRKFGHRHPDAIVRIQKELLGIGMKINDCGIRQVCECCLEGKMARKPFPQESDSRTTETLELIHTDLCGPMRTKTAGGEKGYIMTLIDDYSRYCFIYLLKHKSEAAERIKEFVRQMFTRYGKKPKIIRSDNGGEYTGKMLREFYKKEGICCQFTVPHSPQQNGVAERKNRSLTEMANCMLIDAGLEKRYWGEAVHTANYIQNRMLSNAIATTPYELWHGYKPDFGNIHIFGSETYVHVPKETRVKFDAKARKMIFIGYSEEHKGYRFLDKCNDKVTISRDAFFMELKNRSTGPDQSINATKATGNFIEFNVNNKNDTNSDNLEEDEDFQLAQEELETDEEINNISMTENLPRRSKKK